LSTSTLIQPKPASNWKQEVSLRIAAHRSRQGLAPVQTAQPATGRGQQTAGSRAAQAAARVAARYAQAPSYSQMQALEAEAAERAEKAAAKLQDAVDAQATVVHPVQAAEAVEPIRPVQPIEAAAAAPKNDQPAPRRWEPAPAEAVREWEPILTPQPAPPSTLDAWGSEFSHLFHEPKAVLRPAEGAQVPRTLPSRFFEEFDTRCEEAGIQLEQAEPRFEQAAPREDAVPARTENLWSEEELQAIEPDQPINVNLIEFPRELVATRRMRPHLIESPLGDESANRQLSIFEVDPAAISVQHEPVAAATQWPGTPGTGADWSDIELDAEPVEEPQPEATESLPGLYLAPISSRLMASFIDSAIIAGAVLAAAVVAAANISHPFAPRAVEVCALSTIVIGSLLYHALFLTLSEATPGMRSAGISLCTFDDQVPTRRQLRARLGALALSLLPVGLGVVWVLFDEDHLCWHDRLSQTYLRKN